MSPTSSPKPGIGPKSIKSRLLLILGLAALAVGAASAFALIALTQIRDQVESVTMRELPASEAAQLLARIGERLQDRTPALIVLKDMAARQRQMDLIEQDLQALKVESAKLHGLAPAQGETDVSFSALTTALGHNLHDIAALIDRQAELGHAAAVQRDRLMALRERAQQILGPSILAVTAVVDRDRVVADDIFRRAASAQGVLLNAERLFGAAFGELLIASEASSPEHVRQSKAAFTRIHQHLVALSPRIPSGLRADLDVAIADLGEQLGADGVLALRASELRAVGEAERLERSNRRIATELKAEVDALARGANAKIASAAHAMGESVLESTIIFAFAAVGAVLIATLLSYRLVVRDISLNLRAVTDAMQRLADGERQAQVPATERRDEIGDLARVFNVFKDQAFRVEALDRELAEKSRVLLATFDSMNDGLTVLDGDERLIAWNPRCAGLYGLEDADMRYGAPLSELHARLGERGVHVLGPQGEEMPLTSLGAERRALSREYEVRCPDGRRIELRSNPMPAGGFVTIHIDVTARREIERQLRQAQKMEAVGQLTGGIAHDFNNILAAIQGNLTFLEDGVRAQPGLYARWKKAMGATDRAARQVERLLAFSRRQRLEPEVVDINVLVTGMLDLLEYSLGADIELESALAPDLPWIRIDPGQLENAVMNLAINARDAIDGRGRIRIRTVRASEGEVELCVEDTGSGMSQDIIDRVFEPFFTTKPGGKGSGLGLSMVYGFVQQSGGRIEIESEPGLGSRVRIRLPTASVRCAPVSPASEGPASPSGGPLGGGDSVLVVEDDAALLEVTAAQIVSLGYRVTTARDGPEALKTLEREPDIGLLYTDIGLPAPMDGLALAEEARRLRPSLRVVYTSAQACALPDAAVFVQKPVSLARLARTLERCFAC